MTSTNSQQQIWQIRSLKLLETLIRTGTDLPIMVWTVGPLGIVGEPYMPSTDADRRVAIDHWALALGAVHWAPHTNEGMTRLIASVKDYNGSGTTIMVKTTLYGDAEQAAEQGPA